MGWRLPALALLQGCIELLAQAPRVVFQGGNSVTCAWRCRSNSWPSAIEDRRRTAIVALLAGKERGSTSLLIWTGTVEPLRSLVESRGTQ